MLTHGLQAVNNFLLYSPDGLETYGPKVLSEEIEDRIRIWLFRYSLFNILLRTVITILIEDPLCRIKATRCYFCHRIFIISVEPLFHGIFT